MRKSVAVFVSSGVEGGTLEVHPIREGERPRYAYLEVTVLVVLAIVRGLLEETLSLLVLLRLVCERRVLAIERRSRA